MQYKMAKRTNKKTNNDQQNTKHKTNDRATRTPPTTLGRGVTQVLLLYMLHPSCDSNDEPSNFVIVHLILRYHHGFFGHVPTDNSCCQPMLIMSSH